jgi:hypothetical protein
MTLNNTTRDIPLYREFRMWCQGSMMRLSCQNVPTVNRALEEYFINHPNLPDEAVFAVCCEDNLVTPSLNERSKPSRPRTTMLNASIVKGEQI